MAKGDVLVRMKADVGNYNANLANARRTLQNFKEENLSLGGIVKNMTRSFTVYAAGLMSIGAVAGKLHETVTEAVELAKAGEGIRNAFSRLNDPNLLNGLREATHGTVTDIELMKAAVKFNDFKLPVEELGTMLAFAQQKAKDTGQSVDYMVDSIVTGLGRKSLMILDNLGLSATEVKEKMKETGDMTKAVGEIIREQMSKSGDYVETAADRAAQANVEMQNKLEELGRTFAPIQEAGVGMFNRLKMAAIDALNGMRPFLDQLTEAGRIRQQKEGGGNNKVIGQLNKLKVARAAGSDSYVQWSYNSTIKDYEKQISDLNFTIAAYGKGRDAMEKDNIKRLKEQREAVVQLMNDYKAGAKQYLQPVNAVIDTKQAEQNVKTLTAQLRELEKQRKDAVKKGDQEQIDALTKQINQTKTNIGYLDPKAFSTSKTKATEKPPKDSIADLNNQIKTLRDAQNNVTNVTGWQEFQAQIDDVTNRVKELKGELSNIGAGNMVSLGKIKGVSITDTVTVPTASDMIKRGDQRIKDFKIQDKPTKQETKLADIMGQMNGGISSMVSGIEGLGIEIPKGMQNMLGAINSITMILTSIEAFQKVGTVLGFFGAANGGVVKAAGGYRVPGRTFSGDMVPARLNAGETVLNQAQAGVIANALQDRDFGGGSSMMQPYVDGEHIFLGMNNTSKRMGRGEIVTTSTLRRFGLI